MSEFCPECWNKLNGWNRPWAAYRLSWGRELCEGCGEWKRVVVGERRHWLLPHLLARLFRK